MNIPPSCLDLSPTVSVTAASQILNPLPLSPPEYEPPPSYSSLFPRYFKSSPTPVPHCSHQEPPDWTMLRLDRVFQFRLRFNNSPISTVNKRGVAMEEVKMGSFRPWTKNMRDKCSHMICHKIDRVITLSWLETALAARPPWNLFEIWIWRRS